jgi:hypothetical protein
MKELECEFTGKGQVKGFLFTQLKSNHNAYLYEVKDGKLTHYEVFKRKENIRFNCVSYPKNNSFGVWAFTTRDYNRALQIFVDLSFNKVEDEQNG